LVREFLLLAAALVAAAGAAEAYLRVFAPQQLMSPAYDDRFGMRGFKANVRIKHQTPDYAVHYTTNDRGFRGKSYPFDKPKGTYRIVILGSSIIFGSGVEDDDVFSERLERRLRAALGKRVEVVNLGMMGVSLSLEEYLYRELGRRYQPDLVVLHLFYPRRDALTFQEARRWENVPVGRRSRLKAVLRRLLRDFPGYAYLCESSHLYGLRRLALVEAIDSGPVDSSDAAASGARKFDDLQRNFLSTFRALEERACADGAHLLLSAQRGDLENFPLIYDDLRREARGSSCLSMRELELLPEHFFPSDGHWSRQGHAFVADRLFDFVSERLKTHRWTRIFGTLPSRKGGRPKFSG
jgi:hypothetical protein